YETMKNKWIEEIQKEVQDNFYKDTKHRIEKDVIRTDRHIEFKDLALYNKTNIPSDVVGMTDDDYSICLRDVLMTFVTYNPHHGYVQGMSDLLSPIVYAVQSEVEIFWCFCSWMNVMQNNFSRDQETMQHHLDKVTHIVSLVDPQLHNHFERIGASHYFFCFRWLLVWFKREFDFHDVLYLWEIIWSHHSHDFVYFIASAILVNNRLALLLKPGFDECLRVN
ncbi:RabGAP/TBC, partial [Rozella allomycis CSF55]